jgi:hypothetical protein
MRISFEPIVEILNLKVNDSFVPHNCQSKSYQQITPTRRITWSLALLLHLPWPPETFTGKLN